MSSIESQGPSSGQKLYFAAWRWHFYAGLFVIPFLVMLAVTGLIMLWFTAIAPEFGDRMAVTPGQTMLAPSALVEAALGAHPGGSVDKFVTPIDAAKPALLRVQTEGGALMLAMDPYTGAIVNERPEAGTWNDWATNLHGKLLTGVDGGWADLLIETAASLGLLMVATGLYLAWPRRGEGLSAMLVPNLRAQGRAFWKSTHRAVGTWISVVLAFFLVSGIAWASIWGGKFVQAWNTFPAEKWGAPLSDQTHASMNHTNAKEVPWALEMAPLPESGSIVGVEILPPGTPVVLDSIVELGKAIGFDARMQVVAPGDETAVWTISRDSMSYDSPDPTSDRTVHIDQYTGKVLADVGYADYALGGKAMAVGIALHEGQMGLWNIVLNFAFCLAVIFVSLGALVMWWMRRPAAARLGAPPQSVDAPLTQGMMVIALVLSMLVPLLGATLIAIMVLDLVVLSNIPALKRALS